MSLEARLRAAAMKSFATLDQQAASIRTKRQAQPYGEGASEQEIADYNMSCLMAIDRMTRPDDSYNRMAQSELKRCGVASNELMLSLNGILSALKNHIKEGFFLTFEELVNQSLMSELLDTASGLLVLSQAASGAVVMAGVIELHLRHLAAKNGVKTDEPGTAEKSWRPLRELNDDLRRVAYGDDVHRAVSRFVSIHEAVYRGGRRFSRDALQEDVADLRVFIEDYPA
jgi:hypothetical protein